MLSSHPDLRGRTLVVTGGSRGIGARTAWVFAEQGASVRVVGRDRAALEAVVAGIKERGGAAIGVPTDVTDAVALERLRAEPESGLGPVDVLAAFAGGQGHPVPTTELTEQRRREVIDVDLTSVFLTIRELLPGMLDRRRG